MGLQEYPSQSLPCDCPSETTVDQGLLSLSLQVTCSSRLCTGMTSFLSHP
ncbi:mCG147521 [Mus musculus]|nr:mCG147521 [Mus musculus]